MGVETRTLQVKATVCINVQRHETALEVLILSSSRWFFLEQARALSEMKCTGKERRSKIRFVIYTMPDNGEPWLL